MKLWVSAIGISHEAIEFPGFGPRRSRNSTALAKRSRGPRLDEVSKEAILFWRKGPKNFCALACIGGFASHADANAGREMARRGAGEKTKAFWSFFSKKDYFFLTPA